MKKKSILTTRFFITAGAFFLSFFSGHIAMQEEAAFKLKVWPVTSFCNHDAINVFDMRE